MEMGIIYPRANFSGRLNLSQQTSAQTVTEELIASHHLAKKKK